MKKTLIALTLAALPVASMAEVTLFGTIKGGAEFTKTKGVKNTVTNLNDWDSSIGFKGEEDLGNGLKAIWQLQSKASIDATSGRNGQRNNLTSFIGLDAGAFGKLRAGNLPDAIKDMGDLNLDDSGHGVRAVDNTWERTGKRHTAVRYDSANFGGFSFNLLYSPEDNQRYDQLRKEHDVDDLGNFEGVTGITDECHVADVCEWQTRNSRVASIGLNYSIAGFFVKYGFVHQNDVRHYAPPVDNIGYNRHVHRIMGGYDANNLFVGLGYQYTYGHDADELKTHELALSAAYRIGNVVPRFTYVHGFKDKKGTEVRYTGNYTDAKGVQHAPGDLFKDTTADGNSKYHQVVLGADYYLSKRTTVIASLGWLKEGDGRKAKIIGNVTDRAKEQAYSVGVGLRHKF